MWCKLARKKIYPTLTAARQKAQQEIDQGRVTDLWAYKCCQHYHLTHHGYERENTVVIGKAAR